MRPNPAVSPTAAAVEPIEPNWAWHHGVLLQLRQELLHAKAEHQETATGPAAGGGKAVADAAQKTSAQAIILSELHPEADRLTEIDDALRRIRSHTYGVCEKTGAPIAAARLRAIPWIRYSPPSATTEAAESKLAP